MRTAIQNDPNEQISAYQVLVRATVQLYQAWNGEKFFLDTRYVPCEVADNVKCRGIVSGRVPFVFGVRRAKPEYHMYGHLFLANANWQDWVASTSLIHQDREKAFPLVRASSLETITEKQFAMSTRAFMKITPQGLIQLQGKNEFAALAMNNARFKFKDILDSNYTLTAQQHDESDAKRFYVHDLTYRVQALLAYAITSARNEIQTNGPRIRTCHADFPHTFSRASQTQ